MQGGFFFYPGRQAVKDALQQQATQKEYIDAVHKAVAQMMNSGEVTGEPVQDVANTGNDVKMEGAETLDSSAVAKYTAGKTGIGKLGVGIPAQNIKPEVLNNIYPDDNAVFGYLPKRGSRYDRPEFDFTDIQRVMQNRTIRIKYIEENIPLENKISSMLALGKSNEEIARYVVKARNQQKIDARREMTPEEAAGLGEGNTDKYKNPVGPTPEQKFEDIKRTLIKKGLFNDNEQVWGLVIQKALNKDDVINTLLGIV